MKYNLLRDLLLAFFVLSLLVLLAVKMNGARGEQSFAGAFRVIDGDSLALEKLRFRLVGIDAPELGQLCHRPDGNWPCGHASRDRLRQLASVSGFQCRGGRLDKYRRRLVTCYAEGGDVNAAMVRAGLAVAFGRYEQEEADAKREKAGVWVGSFSRPSDWRRANRAGFEEEGPHMPSFLRRLFDGDG